MTTAAATDHPVVRRRLRVGGVVQGVGFRPNTVRLATGLQLDGLVGNDASGVFVEVQGPQDRVEEFVRLLRSDPPPLARIASVTVESLDSGPSGGGFVIVESGHGDGPRTSIPPDVAVCDECLAEMHAPADRRYRYPFTNCTNCGPRFSVITDLPYDRPSTTMAGFALCDACRAEYDDPSDRRYHAQPVACPACGPQIAFVDGATALSGTDAVLAAAQAALAAGQILALKGVGGYHLACDARSDAAVRLLRRRKNRGDKPFAVMAADLGSAAAMVHLDAASAAALVSPARPIVLAGRRADNPVSLLVAPDNPRLGIMLPYSPLHHLLLAAVPGSSVAAPDLLVLTSGNLSDEPICFDDGDATNRLASLADVFVTHDRPIAVPCDDSVVRVVSGATVPVRRSRGYAPVPVELPVDVRPVLATGGEVKNAFCLAAGRQAWVSQHIGDMEGVETLAAFERGVAGFERMYRVSPEVAAVDSHPGYATGRWARRARRSWEIVEVGHHHAHVASVMAESGLDGSTPVIGFTFDGSGYGTGDDGRPEIWGGEVLLADYRRYRRAAHLRPLPLPGGDSAVANPCRVAVAWTAALGIEAGPAVPAVGACDPTELRLMRQMGATARGCVPTTSMGRLFDAVSSLLGICHRAAFEAQAAVMLEAAAEDGRDGKAELAFGFDGTVIDPAPLLAGILDGLAGGVGVADLARAFHRALADTVAAIAGRLVERHGRLPVALSGGVWQNALLVDMTLERLEGIGTPVLTHRVVPPNDGGLALGQAVIAGYGRS